MLSFSLFSLLAITHVSPTQIPISAGPSRYFDVQAHRGGRGNTIENTLPSFAWGLIDGATTLELDNGITKDGAVVVWHDEIIVPEKCSDTIPAFAGDPDFPYVGKYIASLSLAQLKTLDCGSQRQRDFASQLTYPGTRISTLEEVFDFVGCADPEHHIKWNIESKINAQFPGRTRNVTDFVQKQHTIFAASRYRNSITYQSFDWRSLIAMKKLDPFMITSALISEQTASMPDNSTSPWLGGLRLDSFLGSSIGEQIAEAAHSIRADILSPEANTSGARFAWFTNRQLVERAHALKLLVKPWTVNGLGIVETLMEWKVDGIITDYPNTVRRWVQQHGYPVAARYPRKRVLACLEQHMNLRSAREVSGCVGRG